MVLMDRNDLKFLHWICILLFKGMVNWKITEIQNLWKLIRGVDMTKLSKKERG